MFETEKRILHRL